MKNKVDIVMNSILILSFILLLCLTFMPILEVNSYSYDGEKYTFIKRNKVSMFQVIKSNPKINVTIESHVE